MRLSPASTAPHGTRVAALAAAAALGGAAVRGLTLSFFPDLGAAGMGSAERLWSVRDADERAHGYGSYAGMRLATELGHGLNAFRGRGAMTPFLGTRSGADGRDLRLGVGWMLGEALRFGVEATRSGSASMSPTTACD